VSETTARGLLYTRSGRMCERCGIQRATNAHHRRAAGRRWDVWNLLDLCGSGTTGCHGFVTDQEVALARRYGWVVLSGRDPLWTPSLIATRDGHRWCYLTRDGQRAELADTSDLPPIADAFPDLPELVRVAGRRPTGTSCSPR
jgi:hypothetical protein